MPTDTVEVLAGRCEITDDELRVYHAPLRAINPLVLLISCVILLAAGASLLTDWTYVAEGQPTGPAVLVLLAGLALGPPILDARRKRLLTNARFPLHTIDHVRVETESRRWYLKQDRQLPVVVVTFATDEECDEYPIHLHGRGADDEKRGLLWLFEANGISVRGERLESGSEQ